MALPLRVLDAATPCPADLLSLFTSLQNLSHRLHSPPHQLLLHSTKCRALALCYAVALEALRSQLLNALTSSLAPQTLSLKLIPCLSALFCAMIEGEKFVLDCCTRPGNEFLKKAVVLALSPNALDIHLHDLLWCVFVVNAAIDEVLGATHPNYHPTPGSSMASEIYGKLTNIWAETVDEAQDVNMVLDTLTKLKDSEEANFRLAEFLFHKLANAGQGNEVDDDLPPCLWVDAHDFRFIQPLGEGAYGVVYEVEWRGERFASKEFFGVSKETLGSEPVIQARLQHPNIVQLVCCSESPRRNQVSLVMELMPQNLRHLIKRNMEEGFNPPFSLAAAMDIMLQIARGMEYLHRLHIMHRDLKSLNILVSHDQHTIWDLDRPNSHVRVKIADFGMSKAKHISSMYTTKPAGTLNWRAPEVFGTRPEEEDEHVMGAKYTKKADIYSFAMVCYEILTGKVPWEGVVKPRELQGKVLKGERPKLPSSCPPGLASYIEKCWHETPSERPSFIQISRTLRHLTAVLLTYTDPLSSFALRDPRSCIHIEDKLVLHKGVGWSKDAGSAKSIAFEMSCYKAMAKVIEKESEEAGKYIGEQNSSATTNALTTQPKRSTSKVFKGSIVATGWRKLKKLFSRHSLEREDRWQRTAEGLLKRFSLNELEEATDNFDTRNILGLGFNVYKGHLADGTLVVVKRSKQDWNQGEQLRFQRSVERISMAAHRNLLPLKGFCTTPTEQLLVYPFMPNGSVSSRLHDRAVGEPPLDWPTRKRIALGSARGLSYLHDHCEPKIIHHNVKAANILLDESFEAFVGDFGRAEVMDHKHTHVTNTVNGTTGHAENLSAGKISEKMDVYGFGIMLLELITGQPPFNLARLAFDDDIMLLDWVKRLFRERKIDMIVDPDLKSNYEPHMIERLIQVALLCTQSPPMNRPKMSEVMCMLEGDVLTERWEKWQKKEAIRNQKVPLVHHRASNRIIDSVRSLHASQLSAPR